MHGPALRGLGRRSLPGVEVTATATVTLLAPLVAAAVATVALIHPLGLVATLGAIALGTLLVIGRRLSDVFLVALAVLLLLYATLGRGVAHVGVGSLYIGELVLALGALALISRWRQIRIGAFEVVLIAFIGWGAIRTIPYVGVYGLDSLRDATAWAYALFAVAVAAVLRPRHLTPLVDLYRRLSIPLVFWLPLAAVLTVTLGDRLPTAPGSDVPIIYFKAGDAGVHLAGIAAFVLVGLAARSAAWTWVREAVLWAGWLVSFGLAGALNRGAMVAASMSVVALLFVRRGSTWLIGLAVAVMLLSTAWVANPEVDLGIDRKLSVQQFVENAASIVTASDDTNQNTKEWRLAWWDTIVGYTIDGPYLWTGKGYGINLADDDGFQVDIDGSLRAPHSAHLEFLARSGVPGLALWLLLMAVYLITILRAAYKAAKTGQPFFVAILGWVAVYWLAAIVNMSVDVYLAGPQGGIWFWTMMGVGLAVSRFVWDTAETGTTATDEMSTPA